MPSAAARCSMSSAQRYHWSLMQVEYSTDLIFRSEATLGPLYEHLSRQAVLGGEGRTDRHLPRQKDHPNSPRNSAAASPPASKALASSTAWASRSEDVRQFGRVLRLETTANDVSFFKHHRKVEHRDGPATREVRR